MHRKTKSQPFCEVDMFETPEYYKAVHEHDQKEIAALRSQLAAKNLALVCCEETCTVYATENSQLKAAYANLEAKNKELIDEKCQKEKLSAQVEDNILLVEHITSFYNIPSIKDNPFNSNNPFSMDMIPPWFSFTFSIFNDIIKRLIVLENAAANVIPPTMNIMGDLVLNKENIL